MELLLLTCHSVLPFLLYIHIVHLPLSVSYPPRCPPRRPRPLAHHITRRPRTHTSADYGTPVCCLPAPSWHTSQPLSLILSLRARDVSTGHTTPALLVVVSLVLHIVQFTQHLRCGQLLPHLRLRERHSSGPTRRIVATISTSRYKSEAKEDPAYFCALSPTSSTADTLCSIT